MSPRQVGAGRGVALTCKLSFSLCEQVGYLPLGCRPLCCQPPTACSQRLHHWLSGLRPSHSPSSPPPHSLDFLAPSWANRCFHQLSGWWYLWSPVCLSALPCPIPTLPGHLQLQPAALQPALACGLAGLLLPGLSTNPTPQRLIQPPSQTLR